MATRKNTTKRPAKGSSAKGNARGRQAKKAPAAMPSLGGTANDIVGLLLVVLAIALAVALLLPSSAPVTRLCGETLVLLFGAGALLFPLALLIFALTFFVDDEEPFTAKIALGLALVTLSMLSIVSITYPGAETDSSLVLAHDVLRERGGYVGGGIAWALLSTVGREVGLVVLVGAIIAGVVVCGFSISDAVTRLRSGAAAARDSLHEVSEMRRARRAQRRAERQAAYEYAYEYGMQGDDVYDDYDEPLAYEEPKTTYLGSRTSTVLTRGQTQARIAPAESVAYAEPPRLTNAIAGAVATLTRRRDDADEQIRPAAPAPAEELPWQEAAEAAVEELDGTIPEFLTKAAQGATQPAKTTRKPTKRTASKTPKGSSRKSSGTKRARVAKQPVEDRASEAKPMVQQVADASVKVSEQPLGSRPGDDDETYALPPLSMLSSNPQSANSASTKQELDATMAKLQGTLHEFGLTSRVVDYVSGPLVTTFRVEMGEGERVNKIRNLEDDIALTLAAEKVRIFAPITGTSLVGIEIPNKTRQNVHLGDVLPHAKGGPLEVAIGRDSSGKPVIADIAKMPHMLVAGTTGSGKSVMINSMIMSLLMRATPKQVRLIMVDPKRVEFKGYNGIPHLYVPVVTEPRQAASALQWAVSEMERRLKVFEHAGARNITVYNKMCTDGKLADMEHPPEPMPYLVIVIDELSDLMMVAGKDVEASIVRIAQLARAAGIHLVIATQRPSANVVTGLIKSNIDSRVALKVSSGIDSRVILDETGADRLLGNGDMLFKDRGLAPKRVLGCYTSDPEIESVVEFIRDQGEPDYHEEILSAVVPGQPGAGGGGGIDDEDDPLIWEAAQIVVESQLGSTSGLQRRLKVGYARAGRIMDMLESKGVVGPASGSKPREVLLDEEGLEDLRVQEEKYREV